MTDKIKKLLDARDELALQREILAYRFEILQLKQAINDFTNGDSNSEKQNRDQA